MKNVVETSIVRIITEGFGSKEYGMGDKSLNVAALSALRFSGQE